MQNEKVKIYLSFKNKATAEKWLSERGINASFNKSQVINVYVRSGKSGEKKD